MLVDIKNEVCLNKHNKERGGTRMIFKASSFFINVKKKLNIISCKKIILTLGVSILLLMLMGCSGEDTVSEVDLDLTALSPFMAYAAAERVMTNPDEYLGSVIRVRGEFFNFYIPDEGEYVNFILFDDGAGCCEQGFEIRMRDNLTDTGELPKMDTLIEVVGTFTDCEERGWRTFYLELNEFTVLQED
jgi:hypothetical protein